MGGGTRIVRELYQGIDSYIDGDGIVNASVDSINEIGSVVLGNGDNNIVVSVSVTDTIVSNNSMEIEIDSSVS